MQVHIRRLNGPLQKDEGSALGAEESVLEAMRDVQGEGEDCSASEEIELSLPSPFTFYSTQVASLLVAVTHMQHGSSVFNKMLQPHPDYTNPLRHF